jgi:hypothetical protein
MIAYQPPLPPTYVNVPVALAYAGSVDAGSIDAGHHDAEAHDAGPNDALVVTMIRILGLCWAHGHRRTPALTPGELVELTGRPRSTLYRHLRALEDDLGWLRVERDSRRLVLYPLLPSPPGEPPTTPTPTGAGDACGQRRRLLAAIGVVDPVREELARDPAIDPAWIRAWHLWTRHPHRANVTNPAGVVITLLREHLSPPDDYLQLALLTGRELAQLRASCSAAGPSRLNSALLKLRPLYLEVYGDPGG